MASTTNNASNDTSSGEERVDVGKLVFKIGAEDLDIIKEKIGDVLQAQLILRGDARLGFGEVIISGPADASNAEGGIAGDARLTRASRRGRGAGRGRGSKRNNGRTRRSADEQEGEESSATAAANGVTGLVSGLVDGVKNLVVGESATTGEEGAEKGAAAGARGGKGKKGRGAARAARPRKERGEPSKTLVFIRNIPFSYAEEQIKSLFDEHNLSFTKLSMPVWKFGPRKGKGRGFAFATVSSEEEQKKAIDALNGKEIHTGEMYTPRPAAPKAAATIAAEGGGSISGEGETPAPAAEVAQPEQQERVLKLVARQGYENEEKDSEEKHEQEGAAADAAAAANGATGPEDSGTA